MLTSEEAATLAALNAKAAEIIDEAPPAEVAGETAAEVGAAVAEAVGSVAATVAAVVAHEVSEAHEDAAQAATASFNEQVLAAEGATAAAERKADEAQQLADLAVAVVTVAATLDDDGDGEPVVEDVETLGDVEAAAEDDEAPANAGGAGHPWFRARHWGKGES